MTSSSSGSILPTEPAYPEATRRAAVLCGRGEFSEAERICRDVLQRKPRDYEARRVLGLCAYFQGRFPDALLSLGRALEVNPGSAQAWLNRGIALAALNRHEEAIADYDRAIAIRADYADAFCNRGNALQALNRHEEAVAAYGSAIAIQPDLVDAHANLGVALGVLGRHAEAIAALTLALSLNADLAEAYFGRARILQALNRNQEAIADYDRALAIRPAYAEAYCNRANARQATNHHLEALADYDQALAIDPLLAEAHANRGIALEALNRHEEAIESYDRACSIRPDYTEAHANRAHALQALGRLEEAIASCDRAISIDPTYAEARYGKAYCVLSSGPSEEGWLLYEERLRTKQYQDLPDPGLPLLGAGDPHGKRILVQWEQRFGDVIQMLRYAALLDAVADKSWWQIEPPLRELVARSFPGLRQIEVDARPPDAEYRVPFTSLPLAMRSFEEAAIPAGVPYLKVASEKLASWKDRLGSSPKGPTVAILWRGNEHPPNRSVPIDTFLRLFDIGHLRFVVLQMDLTGQESMALKEHSNVVSPAEPLDSFDDTAAILAGADLVITIDSAVAHLAGALGMPTWILLKVGADWRWMLNRDDSPWYPTARLFRQEQLGEWGPVIARVQRDLTLHFAK